MTLLRMKHRIIIHPLLLSKTAAFSGRNTRHKAAQLLTPIGHLRYLLYPSSLFAVEPLRDASRTVLPDAVPSPIPLPTGKNMEDGRNGEVVTG